VRDWRYSTTAFAAASIAFFLNGFVRAVPTQLIMVLDGAGLALFAVAGTEKALLFDMPPLIAVLLGAITGVGGGTIRDVLLARIPRVLRADIYATAGLGLSPLARAFLGGLLCFALRVISVRRHWNLPSLPSP